MRADAPADLADLLTRLGVATADDVERLHLQVRQMAGELPLLPSLWIDGLLQMRLISPYQAAEIAAGRGERLAVGEYVIESRLATLGFADYFRARDKISRKRVVLLVAVANTVSQDVVVERLCAYRDRLAAFGDERLITAGGMGTSDQAVWLRFAEFDAVPLRRIVQRIGRLPGEAVLEIARRLTALVAGLEARSLIHGDISADSVWLNDHGEIRLLSTGLRDTLCPEIGASYAELPAEAFENVSPERADGRTTAIVAGDLFACGTLWWHLLAGRPAISGATGLGKLRATRQGKIPDVSRFAPDTPVTLARAIASCTAFAVETRPASFTALAEQLGPPTTAGRRSLQSLRHVAQHRLSRLAALADVAFTRKQIGAWSATIAACLFVILLVTWPIWHRPHGDFVGNGSRAAETPSSTERMAAADKVNRDSQLIEKVSPSSLPLATRPPERPNRVQIAAFHEPINEPKALVLPGERLTVSSRYLTALHARQIVRGRPGERPLLLVPPEGLVIVAEDVQLENIDFVWRPSLDAALDPERIAIVDLRAAGIAFKNCTFQAVTPRNVPRPTSVRWTGPRRSGPLPTAGHLQFGGCVFSGVAAGIERNASAPLGIEVSDTLYMDSGPMLRLIKAVRADEPVEFSLSHTTIRESAALLGLSASRPADEESGLITITANNCVFAPPKTGALVLIASVASPQFIARSIVCGGAGSILADGSPVARWIAADARQRASKEVDLPIDGVVSSRIEFVGPKDAGSSASRVSRWMAPTQSVDPPGIPEGLPNLPQVSGE